MTIELLIYNVISNKSCFFASSCIFSSLNQTYSHSLIMDKWHILWCWVHVNGRSVSIQNLSSCLFLFFSRTTCNWRCSLIGTHPRQIVLYIVFTWHVHFLQLFFVYTSSCLAVLLLILCLQTFVLWYSRIHSKQQTSNNVASIVAMWQSYIRCQHLHLYALIK